MNPAKIPTMAPTAGGIRPGYEPTARPMRIKEGCEYVAALEADYKSLMAQIARLEIALLHIIGDERVSDEAEALLHEQRNALENLADILHRRLRLAIKEWAD